MENTNTVMNFNEEAFNKLDCFPNANRGLMSITLQKASNKIRFSASLARACGLANNDRVDLYENGHVLAIKKSPVGCLSMKGTSNGSGFGITNLSAYLAFSIARPAGCREDTHFMAWVDDNGVVLVDMGHPLRGYTKKHSLETAEV